MALKLTLEPVQQEPLSAVLISAPMRDYRLAWLLNSHCYCTFVKIDPFIVKNPRLEQALEFSLYEWIFEDGKRFLLLSNRFENILLDAELPHVDFFLIIEGNATSDSWPQNVRKIRGVTLTQDANSSVLKRLRHLMDELEMQQIKIKKDDQATP